MKIRNIGNEGSACGPPLTRRKVQENEEGFASFVRNCLV